jgi:hypothetical protein
LHKKISILLLLSTILITSLQEAEAQFPQNDTILQNDTIFSPITSDTTDLFSIPFEYPVLPADTLKTDTTQSSGARISSEIKYSSVDSMIYSLDMRKVYLYGDATVSFTDKELKAAYIEYDMQSSIVYATGLPDSTGQIAGRPVFVDGAMTFESQTLRYNFRTRKGYIEAVRTEQEGGYLHSEKTKQDDRGHIHMKDGKYTTCDAEHPHFYVALTRAKSIPGDKIVSGPAYIVLEDIPLPIILPFGFFPNTKTSTSGILIPSYGEENRRGFYLRNGGYYWAINDFVNLTATGDIYTNGTWGLRLSSDYRVRYRFNGNLNFRYYKNVEGFRDLENYSKSFDYSVMWSHNQDAKANPNQSFRASVNLSTNRFDQNHSRILTNALTNTKQSSISYQKSWPGSPFNFSSSFNHTQNSRTGSVDLNFPKASLNMNRIYPFRAKTMVGDRKWFEDIQLSYTGFFDNRIRTTDSLLFTNEIFDNMNMGFKHEIPVSWNYKPKKFNIFTLSPNLRYTGMLYRNYIEKRRELFSTPDTSYFITVRDTINKVTYAQGFYPALSASLAPKIFGMYQFSGKGKLQAIRHVISPTASFSYIPDMSGFLPQYYRELTDESGKVIEKYSIYENGMFGTPSLVGRQRSMSLSLNNNLEMKVREITDTTNKLKTVKIIDNFNFSTSANFEDSIIFRPVSFNTSTSLLKNRLNLSLRGSFDPYAINDRFARINKSEYSQTGKLARLTNVSFSASTRFSSGATRQTGTSQTPGRQVPDDDLGVLPDDTPISEEYDRFNEDYYGEYVDFDVPWSISIDYSLNYNKPAFIPSIIQTIRLSGDFSLTPKWKIGYNTGFDFERFQVTTSNLSIYRDLHCWEMRLTAVPFGIYKSFNFQINVKSAVLQDIKYNKRIPWQDNF